MLELLLEELKPPSPYIGRRCSFTLLPPPLVPTFPKSRIACQQCRTAAVMCLNLPAWGRRPCPTWLRSDSIPDTVSNVACPWNWTLLSAGPQRRASSSKASGLMQSVIGQSRLFWQFCLWEVRWSWRNSGAGRRCKGLGRWSLHRRTGNRSILHAQCWLWSSFASAHGQFHVVATPLIALPWRIRFRLFWNLRFQTGGLWLARWQWFIYLWTVWIDQGLLCLLLWRKRPSQCAWGLSLSWRLSHSST